MNAAYAASICHDFNADGYSCVQMCADESSFVNRASNGFL